MLTNFDTIKKSIAKLDVLKGQLDLATLNGLTKKESLNIKKQIAKLEKNLSGIKNLDKRPDALFVIDTRYEKIAIQEANKLHIPVIALVDSNNSFDGVDYMIPANDDSMSSIDLFLNAISSKIINTRSKFVKPVTQDSEKKPVESAAKTFKKKQVIDLKTESVKPATKQEEETKNNSAENNKEV
jgi:small subunit ribosomal protein S2